MKSQYLYEEDTEKIIGLMYKVHNELGWGYKEKIYEAGAKEELKEHNYTCTSQKYSPILYKGKKIGSNRCDILVDNKILIEIEIGDRLIKRDFDQLNQYLTNFNIKVGLLILFSPSGVVPRRLYNDPNYS